MTAKVLQCFFLQMYYDRVRRNGLAHFCIENCSRLEMDVLEANLQKRK